MTAILPPWVVQASSHPADVFRRQTRLLALGQQGIRLSGDLQVTQNGTPNMSVNVAAGEALVNGTQNTVSQGAYECLNDATVNLAIAASDPTNPRIDIVVAQVRDAAYSGANNDWVLAVVTGTPAPSPSPPATPANAIVLAQVAVAANATSITSGNITDKRPYLSQVSNLRVAGIQAAGGNAPIGGTPPAVGPTNWIVQAGSVVATSSGGSQISVTFPSAFPNGIASIVLSPGDTSPDTNWQPFLQNSTVSLSGFSFLTVQMSSGSGRATILVRVNWIAVGW